MTQIPDQKVLYSINLPQFIQNFKTQVINNIVPHLLQIKRYLNEQNNQEVLNPVVLVLTIFLIGVIIKNVLTELFGKRPQINTGRQQSPQLLGEVNDLKKQLKGLKISFAEMMKDLPQQSGNTSVSNSTQDIQSNEDNKTQELLTHLLPLYSNSLQNNKKLVNYVLESQFQMLKQLKRFKKLQRSTISDGRPSTSTVRSKTSDKKVQSSISSKSPAKMINSIKKTQIKNTQRLIRSQINEKTQKKTEDSFLIPVQQTPKIQRLNYHETTVITQSNIDKIQDKKPDRQINKAYAKHPKQSSFIEEEVTFDPRVQIKQIPVVQERKNEKLQVVEETLIQEIVVNENAQNAEIHTETTEITTKIQTVEENANIQLQRIQNEQINEGMAQQQEPQIIIPPKLPTIKKMNPPRPGGKRPPPPPPKK